MSEVQLTPEAATRASELPRLSEQLDVLIRALTQEGALGLISVDATVLREIERRYGGQVLRDSLDVLLETLMPTLQEALGPKPWVMGEALEPERLLIFAPKPRTDRAFYSGTLRRLTERVREHVSLALQRIVYPYITGIFDVPVGSAMVFHRPLQRSEGEIRRLLTAALDNGVHCAEHMRRERAVLLEQLIIEEKLSTVFEPVVSLNDGRVLGYEALSRGPSGSPLSSPMVCFNVAQRCDLDYELDTVCRKLALSNARGLGPDELLFLNILPSSIHDVDFTDTGTWAPLENVALSPAQIVFEISERQTIGNYPRFREALDRLSSLGFRIAVDDVGSGYSNLEAAIELSPSFLKIDRTLIHQIHGDPQKQEILRGLVRLGEKMKASVVAEGIESDEEKESLRDLGVGYGQGYAIGRGRSSLGAKTDAPLGGG